MTVADFSVCTDHACQNSASCEPDPSAKFGYKCHCTEGFSGPFCKHGESSVKDGNFVYPEIVW